MAHDEQIYIKIHVQRGLESPEMTSCLMDIVPEWESSSALLVLKPARPQVQWDMDKILRARTERALLCGFLSFSCRTFCDVWQIRFRHLLENLKCCWTFTHADFSNWIFFPFEANGVRTEISADNLWSYIAGKVHYWGLLVSKKHTIYDLENLLTCLCLSLISKGVHPISSRFKSLLHLIYLHLKI